MSDPYTGEIRLFVGNYAPQGWALCDGSLLSVEEYAVLFSRIGVMYGGDGMNLFGLPDLRSRVPLHMGAGADAIPYSMGQPGLEARLLPGVIADLEYWDDAALMGGHWTVGARVSVPFSVVNLVRGRNPFEGAREAFVPGRKRAFAERMDEMVIRSHRVLTTTSGPLPSGQSLSRRVLSRPPAPPAPAPTQRPYVVPLE